MVRKRGFYMSERKKYDPGLVKVGELLKEKEKLWALNIKHENTLLNLEAPNYSITATGYHRVIWQILNLAKTGSALKN